MKRILFVAALMFASSGLAQQQPAQRGGLVNGDIQQRTVQRPLADEINGIARQQSGKVVWVAYSMPVVNGEHQMCCWATIESAKIGAGRCRLEGSENYSFSGSMRGDDIPIVNRDTFWVLYRLEAGKVSKIRTYSCDCSIDAQGTTVVVLDGVKPAESIAYLAALGGNAVEDKKWENRAIDAIALHDHADAEAALERFATSGSTDSRRGHAAFWLTRTRGKSGLDKVLKLMRTEPDDGARRKFIFAVSQSDEPNAEDELMKLAKSDASTRVRGEAIFWLAQKAGKKAVGAITDAIDNDPDTDVKKKAVFALSQLPKDDGVPKLIEVARTHRNPAVRKQAFFWLGESRDPRALAFIEEILKK